MITVEINDRAVEAALRRISAAMSDMTPVMNDLGELLVAATKDRFKAGSGPEGNAWAAKSPATTAAYARRRDRFDPRPLWGPSNSLNAQIFHQATSDSVTIGSPLIYAAMMQFGGTKAQFPHLWGDIPARPFLGLSDDDSANVIDAIEEWLEGLAAG